MRNQIKPAFINLSFLLILFFLAGCQNKEPKMDLATYESEKYGISFSYPSSFERVEEGPNNFALLDKDKNAILIIVEENPSTQNLVDLGKDEAYKDMFPKITDRENIYEHVKIMAINKREWYNYAIDFPSEDTKSIISGTLCGKNQVSIVLVTKNDAYEKNELIYTIILNSFKC